MIVVSDTSPICYLLLIDQIMILQKLYDVVVIPQAVAVDILTAVKRTVIPKPHDLGFCFFPLRGSAPALTE
ncbi:MAG: hypothetical protein ACK544_02790 [Microcystis sp.]|jgi:predicted nucleic acid-binding protein